MTDVEDILQLFDSHGDSQYGGECVTQREHALQAALLAEQDQAPAALITAALLHDIGHLLHHLPDDAPEHGVDDYHETSGYNFLCRVFPASVTEPVRLHVAAKRYLCAVDNDYHSQLSLPSRTSLELQGGLMTANEADSFAAGPFADDAVRLRRWDDAAKAEGLPTPPISYFAGYVCQVATGV